MLALPANKSGCGGADADKPENGHRGDWHSREVRSNRSSSCTSQFSRNSWFCKLISYLYYSNIRYIWGHNSASLKGARPWQEFVEAEKYAEYEIYTGRAWHSGFGGPHSHLQSNWLLTKSVIGCNSS